MLTIPDEAIRFMRETFSQKLDFSHLELIPQELVKGGLSIPLPYTRQEIYNANIYEKVIEMLRETRSLKQYDTAKVNSSIEKAILELKESNPGLPRMSPEEKKQNMCPPNGKIIYYNQNLEELPELTSELQVYYNSMFIHELFHIARHLGGYIKKFPNMEEGAAALTQILYVESLIGIEGYAEGVRWFEQQLDGENKKQEKIKNQTIPGGIIETIFLLEKFLEISHHYGKEGLPELVHMFDESICENVEQGLIYRKLFHKVNQYLTNS